MSNKRMFQPLSCRRDGQIEEEEGGEEEGSFRFASSFGYSAVLPGTAVFRRVAPAPS